METAMEQITGADRWRTRRAGSALAHLDEERGGVARATDWVVRRTRFLGWFSIGLGLAQLTSPGRMSSFVLGGDLPRRRRAMRLLGAREIASGIGILTRRRPSGWLWMRVLGDAMDLALLGASLSARRTDQGKVVRSMASVAGVMALDVLTSLQVQRRSRPVVGVRRFTSAVTVNRPPEEVYRFWRNLQNLPRFMAHLESVHLHDERHSRWVARGPGRARIEWEAEIIEDRPNERLSWRSVGESTADNAGTVTFAPAPGGRGTEVILDLEYLPPGGRLGAALAKLTGGAVSQQVASDLRRFKQVIETGEVLHSDASIHRGPHPARPPRDRELANLGGRR